MSKIEDITDVWRDDAKIDDVELDTESLKIPNLHAKYLKLLSEERMRLRSMRQQRKVTYRELADYYKGDLNNTEDLKRIEREPWPRTVLKQDLDSYVDADDIMIKLTTRIVYQEEIVSVCEEILKSINARGYAIKNAIDWRRLTNFGQ
jgi:hypothetical protein